MRRGSPEEIWFFGRTSAFAIVIATIYVFFTHDTFGTVLLYGFGIASGVAALILWMELHRARETLSSGEERAQETLGVPFSDEEGRVPQGSLAPLGVGVGIGIACFGLVFGPWLILLGGVIALASGRDWLRDISREWDAVERSDHPASAVTPTAPLTPTAPVPQGGSAGTPGATAVSGASAVPTPRH